MEDAKRQQLLKQQQQQHFQKQQELFRKQKQEEQRLRQQRSVQRRQQEQHRQQELLRSLQESTASEGSTVVHVTPDVDVTSQMSDLQLNGAVQATPTSPPPSPSTASSSVKPQPSYQTHPVSRSKPTTPTAQLTRAATTQERSSSATSNSKSVSINGAQDKQHPSPCTQPLSDTDNRVLLKDGTQIIIQQMDEILFIGPTGTQMVVNCLPLYDPPHVVFPTEEIDHVTKSRSAPKSNSRLSRRPFRKAKSLSSVAIGEIELSDEERAAKSDDELLQSPSVTRRKRQRFGTGSYGAHYSVKVHNRITEGPATESLDSELTVGTTIIESTEEASTVQKLGDEAIEGEKMKPIPSLETAPSAISKKGDPSVENNPLESGDVVMRKSSPHRRKSNSTGSLAEIEDRSDSEEPKGVMEVNYYSTTLPRLKRSSGSVSFPQRIHLDGNADPFPNLSQATEVHLTSSEEVDSPTKDDDQSSNHKMESPPSQSENSLTLTSDTTSVIVNSPPSKTLTQTQTGSVDSGFPLDKPSSEAEPTAVSSEAEPTAVSSETGPTAVSHPSPLIPTLLPHPPTTIDQDYVSRSGWLNKLSHRKGVFGDKWQKRYFVLHRSWLYYFKKYGDSNPKGAIRLLPTGWSRSMSQGTPRMPDAVANTNESNPGIISVLRCLAVHRPNNFAASLAALLGTDGVAEAFRCQTVSVSNTQHSSRTFYMTASSNEERDAWVEAVMTNIQEYSHSDEALTIASRELRCMLRAVKSNAPPKDIPCLLLLLHSKRKEVMAKHVQSCDSNH